MSRIYFPSDGVSSWQQLLADPVLHWKPGYSAMTLASAWEAANGLPPEIARMLEAIGPNPDLLLAIPEHKVPLPGARRGESQSDLFALLKAGDRTIAAAIEGKVDEPFDRTLGEWLVDASPGKRERLEFLSNLLSLNQPLPNDIHYQLLHRTAAAVIEARRFKTDVACMIVHSFSPTARWFDAFARFVELFGREAEKENLIVLRPDDSPPLYVGWAVGDPRFLAPVREVTGSK